MRWPMSLPVAACIVALTAAGCTDTTGGIAKTDSPASNQSVSASASTPVTNTLPGRTQPRRTTTTGRALIPALRIQQMNCGHGA